MAMGLSVLWMLASVADAACLSGAIPWAQRSAVLVPGSAPRPVGLWTPQRPAGEVTSAMLQILIEERLGYLVTQTLNGSETSDAFYALCRCEPTAATAGALCGEGLHDVTLDAWTPPGYWERLIQTLDGRISPPRNLGNMGYFGTRSIYLPREVQEAAYEAEGLALQFYLSYNTTWHDATKYFAQVNGSDSSVTERLKFCNETRLMSSSLMTGYLRVTGDLDGLDNSTGELHGRCFEEFFWLAPKCRGLGRCVMFFTGGDGWNLEDSMQKATAWQLPLRMAVAKSQEDLVALPREVSPSLFYWWVPDSTFLALKPMELIGPRHDPMAHAAGDYQTAAPEVSVDKYVSQDLALMAPQVLQLLEAFQLPLSAVNGLLEDQVTSGDSYQTVACRWLQGNQELWQTWLPAPASCSEHFGLFDQTTGAFVGAEALPFASGDLDCQPCEGGYFSARTDGGQSTYLCLPCGLGTFQAQNASLSCNPCPEGRYQDKNGSTTCKRCGIGSYQDLQGQSACKICPHGTTSLGYISVELSDCGCNESTINVAEGRINCQSCSNGLHCPFASTLEGLKTGQSRLGQRFVPEVQRGYYSSCEDPLDVFRCRKQWHCPGTVPGQCAGGRIGSSCAQCPEGKTWLQGQCRDCSAGFLVIWAIGIVLVFVLVTGSYYFVSNEVSPKASTSEAISMIQLNMIGVFQIVAIIGLVDVEWPEEVEILFSNAQLFILDLDYWGLRCVVGNRTISTIGSLTLLAHTTLSCVANAPFTCFLHPNNKRSVQAFPEILCDDAEADIMRTIGLALQTLYVVGFQVICTYAAYNMPFWVANKRRQMVRSFRFMIFRCRVDCWWFEAFLMLRGPLMSLTMVLMVDSTALQIFSVTMILALFLMVLVFVWPWKVPLLNLFDALMTLALMLLVMVAPAAHRSDGKQVSAVVMGIFGTMVLSLALLVLFVILHRRVLLEDNVFFNLGTLHSARTVREKLQFFSTAMLHLESEAIETALQQISVHDLRTITVSLDLLATELIPEVQENPATGDFGRSRSRNSVTAVMLRASQQSTGEFDIFERCITPGSDLIVATPLDQEPQELEEPPQLEEIQLHCGAPEEEQMAQMEEMQPPLDEPPEDQRVISLEC
ncbi:Soluble TNF receptor II (Cytokine response-modifying protein B) [Durusdinium trenchii]|uniref:Soluble TNF receptor II (Cytokine response-modifying protein B) n=1 Tax=Durusdinium trenchii TaxID=1381693 RepID=A0ABP0HYA6_9DINO